MKKLLVLIQHYFFQLREKFLDSYVDSLANELANLEDEDNLLDFDLLRDEDVTWVYLGTELGRAALPKVSLAGIEFYVHGAEELDTACAIFEAGMLEPIILVHYEFFCRLTERELISVLLHEYGHIHYRDVHARRRQTVEFEDLSLVFKLWRMIVLHHQERRADRVTKRFGYGPDLASALQKMQGEEFEYVDPTLVSVLLGGPNHPSTLSRVARLRR